MASLRKRFQNRVESADAPPVQTAPTAAAQLPDPVPDAPKPPELKTESPADVAASAALRDRLKEMENAEQLVRQAAQQHPQYAAEPPQEPQQPPAMPARVEKWLADHPQYLDPNDSVAQAEIHLATVKCMRDGKTWDAPDFIDTIERHLGFAPATNGRTQDMRVESRPSPPAPQVAPPRQRMAVPVSAPPTRESPSMATGRAPSHRAPLNADELYIAQQSGQTPEQYQEQKERLRKLKESGAIQ
jgi:hypothetical protein